MEFKEKKREIMIELIDILDDGEVAEEFLHNEDILRSSMVMIEKNIFRTFANKSKYTFWFLILFALKRNLKFLWLPSIQIIKSIS